LGVGRALAYTCHPSAPSLDYTLAPTYLFTKPWTRPSTCKFDFQRKLKVNPHIRTRGGKILEDWVKEPSQKCKLYAIWILEFYIYIIILGLERYIATRKNPFHLVSFTILLTNCLRQKSKAWLQYSLVYISQYKKFANLSCESMHVHKRMI
jgi:hypothetical protein